MIKNAHLVEKQINMEALCLFFVVENELLKRLELIHLAWLIFSGCFQVYTPCVQVKRILKNGTISIRPKQLFPGCVFLRCVLNKHLHDFIRECDGVGGFVGSKVGNK